MFEDLFENWNGNGLYTPQRWSIVLANCMHFWFACVTPPVFIRVPGEAAR